MTKYKTIEETNTEIWHLIRHLSLFRPTVEKYEELQGLVDDLHTLHTTELLNIYEKVRNIKISTSRNQREMIDMLDDIVYPHPVGESP